jgi:ribosomal protein S18 acetylase RimI-like enzyme
VLLTEAELARKAAHQSDNELNYARFGCYHTALGRVLKGHRRALLEDAAMDRPPPGIEPVRHVIEGARAFNAHHGLGDPHGDVDYHRVRTHRGLLTDLAKAYDRMPEDDPEAHRHFAAMGREVDRQYEHMTNRMGIHVQVTDHDPYRDVHELREDVANNHRIKVLGTHATGGHPFFSNEQNDRFRAVHDLFGHLGTGRDFDRHGEEAAFQAHARMFTPQARGALASETRAQNAHLITTGRFGAQKIALMPKRLWHPGLAHMAASDPSWENDFHAIQRAASGSSGLHASRGRGRVGTADERRVPLGRSESSGTYRTRVARADGPRSGSGRRTRTATQDSQFDFRVRRHPGLESDILNLPSELRPKLHNRIIEMARGHEPPDTHDLDEEPLSRGRWRAGTIMDETDPQHEQDRWRWIHRYHGGDLQIFAAGAHHKPGEPVDPDAPPDIYRHARERWEDPDRRYFAAIEYVAMGHAGPDYTGLSFTDTQHHQYREISYRRLQAYHPDHDTPVGEISFSVSPPHAKRPLPLIQIDNVGVPAEHRRRGVATALMNELERQYPDHVIDHGERTKPGADWAKSKYGPGQTRGWSKARERFTTTDLTLNGRPYTAMGQAGPDYEGLTFKDMSGFEYGAHPDLHHHRLLFARHPDEPGYLGHVQYEQHPHEIEIHNLTVHPEYQRRGVASALMGELERRNPGVVINHGMRSSSGTQWAKDFYGHEGPPLNNGQQGWTVAPRTRDRERVAKHVAAEGLPPGYTMAVREDPSTERWGLPALHVKVRHGGREVGALSVHQRDIDDERVGHPNIYVDPEHQRQGLASAMYAEVHRRWPKVPVVHSEHASDAAKALNQRLLEHLPQLHRQAAAERYYHATPYDLDRETHVRSPMETGREPHWGGMGDQEDAQVFGTHSIENAHEWGGEIADSSHYRIYEVQSEGNVEDHSHTWAAPRARILRRVHPPVAKQAAARHTMSLAELRTLPTEDYRVRVDKVRAKMEHEWRHGTDTQRTSWRVHGGPSGYLDQLGADITAHGITEPIVIGHRPNGRTTIYDGTHRALVAHEQGIDPVPVTHLDLVPGQHIAWDNGNHGRGQAPPVPVGRERATGSGRRVGSARGLAQTGGQSVRGTTGRGSSRSVQPDAYRRSSRERSSGSRREGARGQELIVHLPDPHPHLKNDLDRLSDDDHEHYLDRIDVLRTHDLGGNTHLLTHGRLAGWSGTYLHDDAQTHVIVHRRRRYTRVPRLQVLAVGPHDEAYANAERRLSNPSRRFAAADWDEFRRIQDTQRRRYERPGVGGDQEDRDRYFGTGEMRGVGEERLITPKDWITHSRNQRFEDTDPHFQEHWRGYELGHAHGASGRVDAEELEREHARSPHQDHFRAGYGEGLEAAMDRVAVLVGPGTPTAVTIPKTAHVSGNTVDALHCPFCGSGSVTARSDGSIECSFCTAAYTVQVQPQYSAFPQTVNDMPYPWPGRDDLGAGGLPGGVVDEQDGEQDEADGEQDGDGSVPPWLGGGEGDDQDAEDEADEGEDEDEPEDDEASVHGSKAPPFGKKKSYLNTRGQELSEEDYLRHLAILVSPDPAAMAAKVRKQRVGA